MRDKDKVIPDVDCRPLVIRGAMQRVPDTHALASVATMASTVIRGAMQRVLDTHALASEANPDN